MKWVLAENFDNDILRGVLNRELNFDAVRAQDRDEISGRDDVALLGYGYPEWTSLTYA